MLRLNLETVQRIHSQSVILRCLILIKELLFAIGIGSQLDGHDDTSVCYRGTIVLVKDQCL